jgi:hypothetical protein
LRHARATALFLLLLCVFIAVTRWLAAPKYLYYFDSANFALSLEHFDPALHQPQPPGYPLFVGLIRVIHLIVQSPERVLLIAGVLGSCVATLLLYWMTAGLFGRAPGILSAALLASNPVFWFGGVTNQIRVFIAVSVAGVGLAAWRALQGPHRARWLCATFAVLGIAAGFRPAEATLLLPLAAWVWWRNGPSLRRLLPGLCLCATALPWLFVTLQIVGGPWRMLAIMRDYTNSQFQGTSWFYGASFEAAWRMLRLAMAWHLYGSIAWIWVVFFVRRRVPTPLRRDQAVFLALAFSPCFLFSGFIHIGDPDQALGSISVLCAVGGAVLSAFLDRIGVGRVFAAAVLVLAGNCALFFAPPYHAARAASYEFVRGIDRMISSAIDTLSDLRRDGPLTIVHWGSPVSSRQIEYYFPDDYVDVLPGGPEGRAPNETPMVFYHHETLPLPAGASGLIRPATRHIVCLLPPKRAAALSGWTWIRRGPLFVLDAGADGGIDFGPYHVLRANK